MKQLKDFPLIEISGNPFERGYAYGMQCASRIHDTYRFYRKMFLQPEDKLKAWSKIYLRHVQELAPHLREEIRGIAAGASISEENIMLINARNEFLRRAGKCAAECTAIAFPDAKLIGQTWDWEKRVGELAILLRVNKDDGNHLIMLVEPGMIGKIGMNAAGIGVCMNFLENYYYPTTPGLPFHVLSRLILESISIDEASRRVKYLGGHAAGHLLVGSSSSKACLSIELAGKKHFTKISTEPTIHTNHYLVLNGTERGLGCIHSKCRLRRAQKLVQTSEHTISDLKRILQDRKGFFFPIYRRYYLPDFNMGKFGTVAILVMELDKKRFFIKRGGLSGDSFYTVVL